jgi:hypothetical protein
MKAPVPVLNRRRFAAAALSLPAFTACGPRAPFQVATVFRASEIQCAGSWERSRKTPEEVLLFVELKKLPPADEMYKAEEVSLTWDGGRATPGRTAWMSTEDKQTKKPVAAGFTMVFSVPREQRKFTLAVRNYPPVRIEAPEMIENSRSQC